MNERQLEILQHALAERDELRSQVARLHAELAEAKEMELDLRAEIRDEEKSNDAALHKLQDQGQRERALSDQLAEALEEAIVHPIEGDGARWNGHNRKIHAALAQHAAERAAKPNNIRKIVDPTPSNRTP